VTQTAPSVTSVFTARERYSRLRSGSAVAAMNTIAAKGV